ncbi:MAG: DUF5906 domain-containing protein [Lactobacillaceae bacterium]|jgi:hypothetical protein|nr:DUF5906 domain-containing protein [Lactobacillaceae bacterium]
MANNGMAKFNEKTVIPWSVDDDEISPAQFVSKIPWLTYQENRKTGNVKYKIKSVEEFAVWYVNQAESLIKGDYGYIWNGSYWKAVKPSEVLNNLYMSVIGLTDKLEIAQTKKRELERDTKEYLIGLGKSFDDSIKTEYVAFKNATLTLDTMLLDQPNKQQNIIGGFDFDVSDDDRLPETWIKYVDYMFGENSRIFWAWLGYGFYNDMRWWQGALFLLDPIGGTGKTYLVSKLAKALFGEERVGAFKLKNLQGSSARFETSRFIGKAIMLDDDATKVRFKEDDIFKSVTGGGISPVERKGIDGTDYMITAKIIANVNEMPVFNSGGAVTRRLHILRTVAPVATKDEIEKRNQMFPDGLLQEEIPRLIPYTVEMFQKAYKEDWQILNDIAAEVVEDDPFEQWHKRIGSGTYRSTELYQGYVDEFNDMYPGENEQPMSIQKWGRQMANWNDSFKNRAGKFYTFK